MKKTILLLICMAAFVLALYGCREKADNITFTATVDELLDSAILVSTTDDVGFDKARVAIGDDVDLSFDLAVGQIVKITILPQIAESYPVQVTAVTIELIAEPAQSDPYQADYTAAFYRADSLTDGGWDFIAGQAVNADLLSISSVRHIPVISVTSREDMDTFIDAGEAYFQLDIAYDENMSFSDGMQAYDDGFFSDNQLLILYLQEPSGSIRHKITDTPISGGKLSVAVESIVPEEGTDDLADWFIILELAKDEIVGVETFDAHYATKDSVTE